MTTDSLAFLKTGWPLLFGSMCRLSIVAEDGGGNSYFSSTFSWHPLPFFLIKRKKRHLKEQTKEWVPCDAWCDWVFSWDVSEESQPHEEQGGRCLCGPRAPLGWRFSLQAEEGDQSRCQKPPTCERSGRNSQGKEETISGREGIGVKRDGNRRCRWLLRRSFFWSLGCHSYSTVSTRKLRVRLPCERPLAQDVSL